MFSDIIFPVLIAIILLVIVILVIAYLVRIVPQANAYVIERLGAYHSTWSTGIHILIPFVDRVANRVTLKEVVKDFEEFCQISDVIVTNRWNDCLQNVKDKVFTRDLYGNN